MFLTSIAIFEIGSVVCGAAPTSTALIIGRAIAGVGSSGIFSGALLILGHSIPLVKRPAYIGMIGGMYGIASISGPLIGGAFTDKVVRNESARDTSPAHKSYSSHGDGVFTSTCPSELSPWQSLDSSSKVLNKRY